MKEPKITVGQDMLQLISELDEFKGKWLALKTMSPERLQQLRKVYPPRIGFPANCTSYLLPDCVAIPRNRPTITRHRALPGNKYDAPFTRETYPRWV